MKKITKKSGIFLLFLFIFTDVYAHILKWNIPLDDRLEIVKTARINYYKNSRLMRTYDERNIIDLTCYDIKKNIHGVQGIFSVYRKESAERVFRLEEKYHTNFSIESSGYFHVPRQYIMPNLRHLPTFTNKDIIPGNHWSSPAELNINSFSIPLKLLLTVDYTFISEIKKDSREIAVINYYYIIDKDLTLHNVPQDMPIKIFGQNAGILYWDITNNQPIKTNDRYNILFLFYNRTLGYYSTEFRMEMNSHHKLYGLISPKQMEKEKKELQKKLPKDSGIIVDTEKRGIVLRLGEILFNFDSHRLRDDTQKTLDAVIDLIKKKYPDREIIVEGHTDNIGTPQYNQKLSEKRARTVAEYIKPYLGHDKLSFKGYGETKPMAYNKTKEDRQKNRRVEMIIKLH